MQFYGKESGVYLDRQRIEREAAAGNWPERVLTDYFDDTLRAHPDKPALVAYKAEDGSRTDFTYADLAAPVKRIAANLLRLGIGKGDVVSFQLPNWWEFVALHLACVRIGAVSNPLMPIFRAHELEFMVGRAESKMLVVPETFHNFDHLALGLALQAKLPALAHVVAAGKQGDGGFAHELLADHGQPLAFEGSRMQPNDIMQLLYTSGTTGEPKGVMHSSNTLLGSIPRVAERLGLGADEVIFMPSPFAHQIGFCYGIMMTFALGATMITTDVWNPATAAGIIEDHAVTCGFAATPFLSDLANLPGIETRNLDRFRLFITSGAPVPPSLVKQAHEILKASVVTGWGMTEVVLATSTLPTGDEADLLTDGSMVPGSEVRVVGDDGRELPRGQIGRLECRGSTLFLGYFRRPDLYAVNEDGWFDTGDEARMDDHGNIRIVGRSKDIIIRGGENIPVVEVENLIYEMPQVADAALIAVPDARLGERGCAFVTLRQGQHMTLEQLVAFLEGKQLARQYLPERLEILDEMPKTPIGKIQKFRLREIASGLSIGGQPAQSG